MKALYFEKHGGIENLVYGEVADPTPGPGEVLIRVKACAINHLDLWVLAGWPGLDLPMPHIGGADIAGEVASVGTSVDYWKQGMRVVVSPGYLSDGPEDEWTERGEDSLSPRYHIFGEGRRGGFAEYVSVPQQCVLELPDRIDFAEAAAPLLVAVTAWRMLNTRAQLQSGESVLIVGAGGGLNSFALQLAKSSGANVIALTSSKEKVQKAKELGADEVINYKQTPDWHKEIKKLTNGRGVDVVVDNVGSQTFEKSIHSTRRGGRIVTVGNTSGAKVSFDNRLLFTKQISILGSTMGSNKEFREVVQTIWGGKVNPVIDRTLPLSQGAQAYRALERGEQFGKILLLPDS